MAATPRGYRIPDLSSPENVPADFARFGSDVDTDIGSIDTDTGLHEMTLATGTGLARWRERRGVVEIVIAATGQNIPSNSGGTVIVAAGQMPFEMQPIFDVYGSCNFGGQKAGQVIVRSNDSGSIYALNDTGATASVVRCRFTYLRG